MSSSIEDKCAQLWSLLKQKAPVLRPKIIVRGFDDDQLLALCLNSSQTDALESALDKFTNSKRGKCCSVCQESVAESGGTFASEWDFDFDKKAQILTRLSYLCELCYALSDLEELLPLLSKPNANVLSHIEKFHSVNGISASDMAPVALVDYMEQCYSTAFSLRIILANFPSWTLVDSERQPFTESTDFFALAQGCLSHIKAPISETASKTKLAPEPSPNKTKAPPKSNLFDLDTKPRKGDSPKRKRESKEENGDEKERGSKKSKH